MSTSTAAKNRLAKETSPYLLQHDTNPVDWFPWGDEAFNEARTKNKPILLSIGYAACHWCHVMAHESFEDDAVAELMNAHFVNIKVDREERPDIDRVYMDALHVMGEQGGWPLTMFLTPDLKPFWGGTYFPPESKFGRPSFSHVLNELSRIWQTEPEKITTNTDALLDRLSAPPPASTNPDPDHDLLEQMIRQVIGAIDLENGGIGRAPKFPQGPLFQLLWSVHQSQPGRGYDAPVWLTMNKISQGGIYDHLGGGIARYAVDEKWLVPHFEKMLYDNAQYITLLCKMQNSAPNELFRQRIEQSVGWLLSDMQTTEGLYASSYDADSEGVEGKYYCWAESEINDLLTNSARVLFSKIYDVSGEGNWEHTNILNRTDHPDLLSDADEALLTQARETLLAHRRNRIAPGWDDKALTDWNALAVIALLNASVTLEDPALEKAALATLEKLQALLRVDGRLHHSFRDDQVRSHATADDYALLISAHLAAYEVTLDRLWTQQAGKLMDEAMEHYFDQSDGAFSMAPKDATDLIIRDKYANDDVTPNANATMVINLWKLAAYLNKPDYRQTAEVVFEWLKPHMTRNPFACPTAWLAFTALAEQTQLVLVGEPEDENFTGLHKACLKISSPNRLIMQVSRDEELPADHPASGKTGLDEPAVFLCRNQTCNLPVTRPEDLLQSGIH